MIRTNCVDCLDRTNLAQFFIGRYCLGLQVCMRASTREIVFSGVSLWRIRSLGWCSMCGRAEAHPVEAWYHCTALGAYIQLVCMTGTDACAGVSEVPRLLLSC